MRLSKLISKFQKTNVSPTRKGKQKSCAQTEKEKTELKCLRRKNCEKKSCLGPSLVSLKNSKQLRHS